MMGEPHGSECVRCSKLDNFHGFGLFSNARWSQLVFAVFALLYYSFIFCSCVFLYFECDCSRISGDNEHLTPISLYAWLIFSLAIVCVFLFEFLWQKYAWGGVRDHHFGGFGLMFWTAIIMRVSPPLDFLVSAVLLSLHQCVPELSWWPCYVALVPQAVYHSWALVVCLVSFFRDHTWFGLFSVTGHTVPGDETETSINMQLKQVLSWGIVRLTGLVAVLWWFQVGRREGEYFRDRVALALEEGEIVQRTARGAVELSSEAFSIMVLWVIVSMMCLLLSVLHAGIHSLVAFHNWKRFRPEPLAAITTTDNVEGAVEVVERIVNSVGLMGVLSASPPTSLQQILATEEGAGSVSSPAAHHRHLSLVGASLSSCGNAPVSDLSGVGWQENRLSEILREDRSVLIGSSLSRQNSFRKESMLAGTTTRIASSSPVPVPTTLGLARSDSFSSVYEGGEACCEGVSYVFSPQRAQKSSSDTSLPSLLPVIRGDCQACVNRLRFFELSHSTSDGGGKESYSSWLGSVLSPSSSTKKRASETFPEGSKAKDADAELVVAKELYKQANVPLPFGLEYSALCPRHVDMVIMEPLKFCECPPEQVTDRQNSNSRFRWTVPPPLPLEYPNEASSLSSSSCGLCAQEAWICARCLLPIGRALLGMVAEEEGEQMTSGSLVSAAEIDAVPTPLITVSQTSPNSPLPSVPPFSQLDRLRGSAVGSVIGRVSGHNRCDTCRHVALHILQSAALKVKNKKRGIAQEEVLRLVANKGFRKWLKQLDKQIHSQHATGN